MRAGQSWLRWPVHGVLNNSANYLGPHGLVQQLQDQSPEPRVWTVDGGSDRAVNRIELSRIDSFVALNRIESFSFLPNRPSLVSTLQWAACGPCVDS